MISEHLYTVEVVGTGHRVSPISGRVTLDESWSPYVQASLTIPLPNDPAVLEALDPRSSARVRLTLRQRFGASQPLSALSDAFAGATVADVSAAWDGLNLSGVSGEYGEPYNAFGTRASTSRRLTLDVRAWNVRYGSGTVDLDLASGEGRLFDLANLDKGVRTPSSPTVRAAVALVLDQLGTYLAAGPDDGAVEADAVAWTPGESGWDYLDPIVKAAGLRLWCDERGQWLLTQPLAPTEGGLALSAATITDLEEQVSRDQGWYDAVHITYRWRDSGDVERVRYDVATSRPDPVRVLSLEYARPWPGDGAAASMLTRAQGRGRVLAATAVSNYSVSPGQALSISTPWVPIQTGLTTRVEWDLTTDEMQVRSRDLIDTPDNAWALIPPGISWDDLPVGMSWDEFDINLLEV